MTTTLYADSGDGEPLELSAAEILDVPLEQPVEVEEVAHLAQVLPLVLLVEEGLDGWTKL